MKEDELSAKDKSKLADAEAKRARKAEKALRENRNVAFNPTGVQKSRTFARVSNGRKHLWQRQYVQNRKNGMILTAEVKDKA